jgi:hypothetical protein
MATVSFKQKLWSKSIMKELATLTGLRTHSDAKYTGEIKGGNTLYITGAVAPTVGDYTQGQDITMQAVAGNTITMVIDHQKYATQVFDDVDRAQSIPGVMESATAEMARVLHEEADKAVAAEIKDAIEDGVTRTKENGSTETLLVPQEANASTVTKANATTRLDDGLQKLRENNVPQATELWGEFSPNYYKFLFQNLTELFTNNVEMAKKGILGKYGNINVTIENLLPRSDAQTTRYNIIRTGRSTAFAGQIDKVEAGRIEKQFADYVKALYVFGTKVVRPAEIYAIKESVEAPVSL